jgi:ribosomal protein L11 methylase PrmA
LGARRQQREDMKHTMVKMLCSGKLYYAPIAEHPQMILDIGTGTGIWAIESEQAPLPRTLECKFDRLVSQWGTCLRARRCWGWT